MKIESPFFFFSKANLFSSKNGNRNLQEIKFKLEIYVCVCCVREVLLSLAAINF